MICPATPQVRPVHESIATVASKVALLPAPGHRVAVQDANGQSLGAPPPHALSFLSEHQISPKTTLVDVSRMFRTYLSFYLSNVNVCNAVKQVTKQFSHHGSPQRWGSSATMAAVARGTAHRCGTCWARLTPPLSKPRRGFDDMFPLLCFALLCSDLLSPLFLCYYTVCYLYFF